MIVVDTNVIAYLWMTGEQTAYAKKLLLEDPEWSAPRLWRSEFRNVMATYLRTGRLSFETALQLIENAEQHMSGREYSVSSERIMNLVKKSSCSAYDCEFVALAQELGEPLVTIDKKILSAFPHIAVPLKR